MSAWRCISCGFLALRSTRRGCASNAPGTAVEVEVTPPLFPGYAFVTIELQWHAAHRAPGTLGLVLNGGGPAHVPDGVIAELRARERGGLIEPSHASGLRRGARVRVTTGPFAGQLGLYAGMRPRDRVTVLMTLLGSAQRVELPKAAIEPT